MSINSVPRGLDDIRAAAGLPRRPVPSAAPADPPRGPGLFAVARANGETAITNVRRLAGAERAPGSRLVVDRVVAVVRRHVLGAAERSVWVTVGRSVAVLARALGFVLLYGLRFFLAPPSTGAGLRRVVLNAAPLPAVPERPAIPAAEEV